MSSLKTSLAQSPVSVLLCFSHLRWDFVYQRPQHLMERAAQTHRVFYVEEPVHAPGLAHLRMRQVPSGVTVITPVMEQHADPIREQRTLIDGLLRVLRPGRVIQWFYTPMAMRFATDLPAGLVIYDCMDELSAFRFAPPELGDLERRLLEKADLVFTGGLSLYAAKTGMHPDVHCFPSSVDVDHFAQARGAVPDPGDQSALPRPRIGYFGVIDERMDLALVAQAAADLPDVQFVMLGPVVKVNPADLPVARNLHWLGRKEYTELPAYMANWQAAWMPFALNESTRFISPTKTPEFLAAGLAVTSTAVADVVQTWGEAGLVRIADAGTMAAALRDSLLPPAHGWRARADAGLADMSWNRTWQEMAQVMDARQDMRVAV